MSKRKFRFISELMTEYAEKKANSGICVPYRELSRMAGKVIDSTCIAGKVWENTRMAGEILAKNLSCMEGERCDDSCALGNPTLGESME